MSINNKFRVLIVPAVIQFLLLFSDVQAKTRAIWVPVWDLKTTGRIDTLFSDLKENDLNQILAEVRYRGDALYFPNKTDRRYSNNEKMCYVIRDSLFDPLDYLVQKANEYRIEIHAWITVFVVTPHKLENIHKKHVFFEQPDWITADFSGRRMQHDVLEGAYLDPGIPAVQEYLHNVIMDIAVNYDIDGIHLDYIRYPGIEYGYNEVARSHFKQEVKYQNAESWQKWKQDQVSNFVKDMYADLKSYSRKIKLTAAVIPKLEKARIQYAQDWLGWLEEDFIDEIYLMAYWRDQDIFLDNIDMVSAMQQNKNIIVGLRAWDSSCKYSVSQINKKIEIAYDKKFRGISLFSYSGIRQCGYFMGLRLK